MLLPSNAVLPQNSLNPPTAFEIAATNRRLYQNFMASRTGREAVYSTLPSAESFWAEGAGLTKDVQYIVPASEMARQSVLNGLSPLGSANNATATAASSSGMGVTVTAPVVYSLNAPANSLTIATLAAASPVVSPQQTIMPEGAPIPSYYGYMNPPAPAFSVPSSGPLPPTMAMPGDGVPSGTGCGLSGVAPPWSDAFTSAAASTATAPNPNMPYFVLGAILLAAFGLSQMHEGKAAA